MASSEKVVVTLLAERGAKFDETGEAIASHNRSIVFLPRGVVPDQRIRVELRELGKDDRRGRPLYRAAPAEVEYTERWKDNGDGTASRVKIATDWLLQESEVEVLETRPLGQREGGRTGYSDYQIVWGQDMASSVVEDRGYTKIGLETEQVDRGQLVWKKTGDRQEPRPVQQGGVTAVEVVTKSGQTQVWFDTSGFAMNVSPQTFWALTDPPDWLTQRIEACDRCGQQTKPIMFKDDRSICKFCQPYEAAEAAINTELPMEQRVEIAAEATRLLAGQALPQEAGEAILRATVDHITSDWQRDRLLQKWTGCSWYYFCDDGVFATKLAPAALQVLRYLPQAQGNGLVELVAWLVGGPKVGQFDYYLRTQVNGEIGITPEIIVDQLKRLMVADRLRGSEADRQAALAGLQTLVAKLGAESESVKAVAEILQQEAQDYAAACAEITKVEQTFARRLRRLAAGEIVEVEVNLYNSGNGRAVATAWIIEPDGSAERFDEYFRATVDLDQLLVSHAYSNYAYRYSEHWEVHHLPVTITPQQAAAVKRLEQESRHYFIGPCTGWDLSCKGAVAYATPYSRDFSGDDRELHNEQCASFPIDISKWYVEGKEGTFVVWHRSRGTEWQEKIRLANEQVAQGRWIKLSFRRGRHHKTGEAQWEAGNRHVKYVLDRSTDRQPVEGQSYYCSLGKVLVDTPHFRLQLVCLEPPYPEDAPEPEPPAPIDPVGLEHKGEVTPDMLAALWEKFRS